MAIFHQHNGHISTVVATRKPLTHTHTRSPAADYYASENFFFFSPILEHKSTRHKPYRIYTKSEAEHEKTAKHCKEHNKITEQAKNISF